MSTTQTLARFVASYDSKNIPAEARTLAVRSLVNWAGCALGGARHPAIESALEALQPFFGAPKANIIGRAERADALHAALFNGISSHVLDFDDTHMATLVHPSGPVISALLAASQFYPINGSAFIEAIVIGIDVECRVARSVFPQHYDAGWHITGTAGGFGAAAAVGRALHLDEKQMAWALSIAATQAAGLREMFGTMCKSLHPGRAAQSGLSAALMARAGFTSSERGIEAPRGFAHVMSSAQHLGAATEKLGERWEILTNSFKPYACGVVLHPVIDACLALRGEHHLDPSLIESIDIRAHPLVIELTGKTAPTTGLEGKFSVYHSAAIGLLNDKVGSRHYSDEVVLAADVVSLRQKVNVEIDASIAEDESDVTIKLIDGRSFHKHVDHALGSFARPMLDADIDLKFRDLAETVLTGRQIEEALALLHQVEKLDDAGKIGEILAPRAI
ncbi:MAG: MmgE/PrpD family protein [Betaproteobacteria bacterium]|nr:MmgE/PrpD family protein [Betaproteobacteria bacterium]